MSELYLWNTMNDRKEVFEPLREDRVTMYVCGPTVYNHIHIGNARPIVTFDLLYRQLKRHYREAVYVRNITDVDDKIIASAAQEKRSINEITAKYTESFHDDIARLNVLPPSVEPRATEHIEQMIAMIRKLLDTGFAYREGGNVLFEVAKMPEYGRLSNRDVADMRAGARLEIADYKRSPADFTLWKPAASDEPGWDSPWGWGRPGWHLECSVMAETHLGETIDIHGGGKDLVFPHHENEIAQSVCAHGGKPFARYWVHNGYITLAGDKMSKSEGNFFTLKEALQSFPGEAVRLALMSAHYRKPLDWSSEVAHLACRSLDKWYRMLSDLSAGYAPGEPDAAVTDALNDNLNTPLAIAELHKIAHRATTAPRAERASHLANLRASAACLGILQQQPQEWLHRESQAADAAALLSDEEIETLIAQRRQARVAGDFDKADGIRCELSEAGIILEDSSAGTRWVRQ